MNQVELITKFKEIKKTAYTFGDLQVILGLEKLSANKRIIDLVHQGFLVKLSKNIFVPSFMDYDLEEIASSLYQPAYLSFESALAKYNIIKQKIAVVTFATVFNSFKRDIDGKKIIFSKIKEQLFWGFIKENNLMIAKPEKAILDMIYLVSLGKGEFDFQALDLSNLNLKILSEMLSEFPAKVQEIAKKEILEKVTSF